MVLKKHEKVFHVKGMDTNRGMTGSQGERIASEFLRRKGFVILDCNYRRPWGEIDVIAEKDGIVRFVEVKTVTRSSNADGSREIDSREISYRPEEMVTASKLKKVVRTAALYMDATGDDREYQIDVIGVILDTGRKIARCRHFEQVLQ